MQGGFGEVHDTGLIVIGAFAMTALSRNYYVLLVLLI